MHFFQQFFFRGGNRAIFLCSCLSLFELVSCDQKPPKQDQSVVVEPGILSGSQDKDGESGKSTSEEKIAKEILKTTADLAKNLVNNRRVKDSILLANRVELCVYQIGLPIQDKDEVFEIYNKLDDKESVYVFEKTRGEYYLVKYEGKTRDELLIELKDYQNGLRSEIKGVKVLDLTKFCSKKKKIVVGGSIKKRKTNSEIQCLICN